MTTLTSDLPYCSHDAPKDVEVSWFMSLGLQETGPICEDCFHYLADRLSKFPDAISTLTIKKALTHDPAGGPDHTPEG